MDVGSLRQIQSANPLDAPTGAPAMILGKDSEKIHNRVCEVVKRRLGGDDTRQATISNLVFGIIEEAVEAAETAAALLPPDRAEYMHKFGGETAMRGVQSWAKNYGSKWDQESPK